MLTKQNKPTIPAPDLQGSESLSKESPPLVAYKLTLSYLGASFAGWQRQKEEVTIQSLIEDSLLKLWKSRISIEASGRTDAGVHAWGQVVSFRATRKHEPETLMRALNAHLPPQIRVIKTEVKKSSFHARFDARAKTYEYRVWNHRILPPFLLGQVLHYTWPLDPKKVRQALHVFVGKHDFASFTSNPGYERLSTKREIFKFKLHQEKELLRFEVTANGFLYRMVRNLVGAALHVGDGTLSITKLKSILKSCDRTQAPASVPPHGLYLKKVHYGAPYPKKSYLGIEKE